jgi:CRISPR-associated protein Cas2
MNKQFLLVSYDISNDRRRYKVMKAMKDYGARVQYSVFECRLLPAEILKLKKRLKPYVRQPQDSIRFYFIGAEDVPRIQVLGSGRVTEEKSVFIQ